MEDKLDANSSPSLNINDIDLASEPSELESPLSSNDKKASIASVGSNGGKCLNNLVSIIRKPQA